MNSKNPHLRLRLLLVTAYEGVGPLSAKDAVGDPKALAAECVVNERKEAMRKHFDASRSDWAHEQMLKKMNESGQKGMFKCHKCGSQKTVHHQMQTRGADEPMTNFVHCLDCNKRWKC